MDLSIQKLGLIHWLTELNDAATINAVEQIRTSAPTDEWWVEISLAEKMSINRGLSDLQTGKTISHTQTRKRYEKWLIH
jgi:hypothetical protein